MKADELKKSFHKRSPEFLTNSFLIGRKEVAKILDEVRLGDTGKEKQELITDSKNLISFQQEILCEILLAKSKAVLTEEDVQNEMIELIDKWHSGEKSKDYKILAGDIIDFLKKEKIIILKKKDDQ